jgi:gliding motility-associated-like protein
VSASDPDDDVLTYTITAGNTGTAFAINSSGQITVSNAAALDFETTPSFALTVTVSDGTLSADAIITINLNDVDESEDVNEAPVADDATRSVDENSVNGTAVHTVSASDPDGDVLTYTITAGNGDDAFAIGDDGVISVNDFSQLDFETSPAFYLTVEISDGERYTQVLVTINLRDLNEPPGITDAVIRIAENLPNGSVVHKFVSDDPDADDTAVFSIEAGNSYMAFIINSSTGEVIVNSIEAFDQLLDAAFILTIMVTDAGGLSASANLTVILERVEKRSNINPLRGFSPNGDGENDFWLIKGIEAFPDNEVKVFSRWGNLVFETRKYDNNNNAWRGIVNNGHPETTYFFVITVEGLQPITGYVIMKP